MIHVTILLAIFTNLRLIQVSTASVNEYTVVSAGCQCNFDSARYDCACCAAGGCQCHYSARHKCVQCGNSDACDLIDHKHCLSGNVVNSGGYFTMTVGTNPPAWPGAGFCQLVWLETKATTYNYTVELYPGFHPGIMFNWQDYQNYDFAYIRPGHPSTCFVHGYVVGKNANFTEPGSSCVPFGYGKWNLMTVAVTPTSVQVYSNGVKYESPWTPQFSSGYMGGATANGYNDVIKYRNFWLTEEDGVIYVNEGCKFKRFKTQSEGVASNCSNGVFKSTVSTTESCIAEACAAGTAVNTVNIIVGTSCVIHQCAMPISQANLLLAPSSSAPTGKDVWVRDFDDCRTAPCKNGGNCTDGLFNYTCICTDTGFTGPTCEININECYSNPCLSGSTCVDQINGYVCTCKPGYTGTHCLLVKLTSHFPSYGPVAGGTNIALTGIFTDIVQLTFTLQKEDAIQNLNDSLVCITVLWNQTHALMKTPRVDDSHSGVNYIIQASYTDLHGASASIKTQFVFTYKPNPAITDIFPRGVLLSGGIKVTAIGNNLDSVSSPVLVITLEERIYGSNNTEYTVVQQTQYISDNTTVNNSTSIIATTPEIPQSTSDDENSPGKHQQNVAYFGVKFDGVEKYKNLSEELGDRGTVQLFSDPVIQGFGEDVLKYDPQTDTHIEIKGQKLNLGASIQDYTVTIGDGLCNMLSPLLDNAVTCIPPSSEPKAVTVTGKEFRPGQPLLMMFVGNAKFYIGYIDYMEETSILLYTLLPVVGLIIIVIVIVSIVVCCKRNYNQENKTQNMSTAGNHSTVSSAMRSDYLSTPSSPNIDSSYLNTSSSQGRHNENLKYAYQPHEKETGRMYTDGHHVSPDQLNIQLNNSNTRYRDGYLAPANQQHCYENSRDYNKAKPVNVRLQQMPFEENHGDAM